MLKKLLICLVFMALLAGQAQANTFKGVTITGSCSSTGPVAGADDMVKLVNSFTQQIKELTEKLSKMIQEATLALQGSQQSNTKTQGQQGANTMNAQLGAQAKMEEPKKMVQETPVNACAPEVGYYMNKDADTINKAIATATAYQRNLGGGITENMRARDAALGQIAKNYDKHGFLFADLTYTEQQNKAAGDAIDLLMPEWKNPRPQFKNDQEASRYMIAEAKARTLRSIISAPLYQFIFQRAPYNPAKEIYEFMGPDSDAYTTTTFTTGENGQVDLNTPPTVADIPESGKISQLALNDSVFKHFTNDTFLAELGGKLSAGVLKEMIKLEAYSYGALNDIRNALQLGNVLLSLDLLDKYERTNRGVEATLVN